MRMAYQKARPRTRQGRKGANNENLAVKETSPGREMKAPLAHEPGKDGRSQVVLVAPQRGIPC